jgi:hypothetical protein
LFVVEDRKAERGYGAAAASEAVDAAIELVDTSGLPLAAATDSLPIELLAPSAFWFATSNYLMENMMLVSIYIFGSNKTNLEACALVLYGSPQLLDEDKEQEFVTITRGMYLKVTGYLRQSSSLVVYFQPKYIVIVLRKEKSPHLLVTLIKKEQSRNAESKDRVFSSLTRKNPL